MMTAIRCAITCVVVLAGGYAQDLAPETLGNSIRQVVYATGPGLVPGPFTFLHSNVGAAYGYNIGAITIGSQAIYRASTFSWTKTGPNTGILQMPAGISDFLADVRQFLTFTAPGKGTFSGTQAGSFTLTTFELTAPAQLRNASSRIVLTPGQASMVGFAVTGDVPRRVLIRAIGPTLARFGIAEVASAPALTLTRGTGIVSTNTGWGGEAALAAAFAAAGAFALPDASADSALLLTLQPGTYTAQVRDTRGGEVLVEVYFVN